MAPTMSTPIPSVPSNPSTPATAPGLRAPSRKMIGTSAKSSNSNMASASLPTGLVVPEIGNTNAVDESASASPRPSAAVLFSPRSASGMPISSAPPMSSVAPNPIRDPRICHNRLNDSSRPMENSNRMMPSSANGSMRSGSLIVTHLSIGNVSVSAPSPNGPTSIPTRMKPMIGVIRKRAKAGMTMPAAPSMSSASLRAPVDSAVAIPSL